MYIHISLHCRKAMHMNILYCYLALLHTGYVQVQHKRIILTFENIQKYYLLILMGSEY
jgi:hypothetical protein